MIRFFSTIVVVALVMNAWLPPSPAGTAQSRIDSAYAEFDINPTGCRRTFAAVEVTQTKTGTQVDFIYFVVSTCQDPGDFLFYHFITGGGSVSRRDFKVQADGKKAVLNTVIPVFDDEGGTDFEMAVQVTWKATGPASNGTRPAIASLSVRDPFESSFITDDIAPSVEASISRTK